MAVQKSALDPGLTSAVFILFSWNYDLFWTSLQTYVAAGWGPRLVIIDNSKSRRVLNDAKVSLHACLCGLGLSVAGLMLTGSSTSLR